ncbi:TlpA family protein disulfide reductase [Saccharobesus litoralis]|uniref:TlpA family protein disulfide reductase n=2 Tax=Saccharobesus litoralis TaxID=2172099 RepID=A0A2S0VXJ3_9ALTE|nr:TlpA family protein disulfide reductase [Saccharobesus litoralis]
MLSACTPVSQAPNFSLYNANGELVSLHDFRGKPLVLTFWSTWCRFCKQLHPRLDQLAKTYQPQGVQVLGISFNEDKGDKPQALLQARGIQFTTLLAGDKVAKLYGVKGTPATFFINRKGELMGTTRTFNPDEPQLIELINKIL